MRICLRTLAVLTALASCAGASLAAESNSPAAEEEPRLTPLFGRVGGIYVIAAVADDFVDGLYADPVLNARPALHSTFKRARKAGLKFQTTSLLCQETGGPCKYDGRSLREAHRELAVTAREWGAAVGLFKHALAAAGVPAAERQELLNLLGTAKGDIVLAPAK